MNDYVATRSDVKLTFPLVSINENYCSWNRSSITTVPYSLLLSTSLIKLRKLSENFTVPPPTSLQFSSPKIHDYSSVIAFSIDFKRKPKFQPPLFVHDTTTLFTDLRLISNDIPPRESFTSTFTTSRIEYRRPIARYFHGWFTCLVHVHLSGV